ncbi:KEOPS complex subunit Cgi121 [Natranaeroarchaeum sulfidigenes]|uniref:Subunit of KEOPS complex (Cgi121BUD32KAE1) n=1 Tax=Natranaeroarchaeum sulfidigenes TaxID=2784880 RepID=A0A897MLC0_9EURY|nr:KEOPS complex subunit Cgi121 [Natranaeroarchaeum sulfidigenes]QSG01384.1 Subunit of KEOPS complex (Cgi121BUD32KAE1) [Natranaeroarchaeum sulfidigenes]
MELLEATIVVDDVDAFVETLAEIGEEYDCTIQAFDARYIAGREHVERARTLADRAIERGENVARDRSVEILLYAAGRRQINDALEMGLEAGDNEAVVLIDGQRESADEAGTVTALRERLELTAGQTLATEHADETLLREFFDIGAAELAATDASLAELVRERVALLDVEK